MKFKVFCGGLTDKLTNFHKFTYDQAIPFLGYELPDHKLTYDQAIPFLGYELPDRKLTYDQAICILGCVLPGGCVLPVTTGLPT